LLTASPSLAGASSFGMSGVNAHVLLSKAAHASEGASIIPNAASQSATEWRNGKRTVCWPRPLLHPLLLSATSEFPLTDRSTATVHFILNLEDATSLGWMRDHSVFGRALLPGAAMIESLWAGAKALQGATDSDKQNNNLGITLSSLVITAALALESRNIVCALHASLGVVSLKTLEGQHHCHATVEALVDSSKDSGLQASMQNELPMGGVELLRSTGNGDSDTALHFALGHSIASLASPEEYCHHQHFYAHPASVDANIHLAPVPPANPNTAVELRVPTAIDTVIIYNSSVGVASSSTAANSMAWVRPLSVNPVNRAALNDVHGRQSWSFLSLEAKPLPAPPTESVEEAVAHWVYSVEWDASEPSSMDEIGTSIEINSASEFRIPAEGAAWAFSTRDVFAPLQLAQQVCVVPTFSI